MGRPNWTLKKEKFCQAFVENGGCGADAYRTAYDTSNMQENTIHSCTYQLLADPVITARIDQLKALQLSRHEVTVDLVIDKIKKIASFDPAKLYNEDGSMKHIKDMDAETRAAINGISYDKSGRLKLKIESSTHAAELLGKYLAIFTDKVHNTNAPAPQVNVNLEVATPEQAAAAYKELLNAPP